LAKQIVPGIDIEFPRDRSIDNEQRRRHVGGGNHPVQAEARVEQSFDGRQDDREIGRLAAGQHRMHRHAFNRGLAKLRRHVTDHFTGIAMPRIQHLAHQRLGGGHDG
jgi:hypothetical protein